MDDGLDVGGGGSVGVRGRRSAAGQINQIKSLIKLRSKLRNNRTASPAPCSSPRDPVQLLMDPLLHVRVVDKVPEGEAQGVAGGLASADEEVRQHVGEVELPFVADERRGL